MSPNRNCVQNYVILESESKRLTTLLWRVFRPKYEDFNRGAKRSLKAARGKPDKLTRPNLEFESTVIFIHHSSNFGLSRANESLG